MRSADLNKSASANLKNNQPPRGCYGKVMVMAGKGIFWHLAPAGMEKIVFPDLSLELSDDRFFYADHVYLYFIKFRREKPAFMIKTLFHGKT